MASRLVLRALATAGSAALTVTAAWAGIGLVPVDVPDPGDGAGAGLTTSGESSSSTGAPSDQDGPLIGELDQGALEVGAAKVSLYPRPDLMTEFPDARWEQDEAKCETLSEAFVAEVAMNAQDHDHLVTSTASPWPENPNCIYMGGYGIGPMNAITSWDVAPGDPGGPEVHDSDPTTSNGLWARAIAVTGTNDETTVVVTLDAEGYFWDYATRGDHLGIKAITERVGAELGIDPAGIVMASSHSHTGPDFIGGWGLVPDWYLAQTAGAIESAITQAVAAQVPATIEIGEVDARVHNRERRDTYRSPEESHLAYLRAVDADNDVIATLGSFGAHPTTRDEAGGVAHADWPGAFDRRLEERFGGIGLHVMTGLGNQSASGGTLMGALLADSVPAVGDGTPLDGTDVRVARTTWDQPVTNVPLSALGLPGFFDRRFNATPASVRTGKSPDTAPCVSNSAFSVELAATAVKIGSNFALSASPGEIFANVGNTLREKSGATVTMPVGQANDALGYMPQQFELNEVGQQGLGFAIGGVLIVNYEDSYSIDRCVGDMVLETTLALFGTL